MSDTVNHNDVALVEPVNEPASEPASEPANDSDGEFSENNSDDSYSEVDLESSELYQVLSLFLQRTPPEGADDDEPTENVTDVLASLKDSVDNLNNLLKTLTTTLATTAKQQAQVQSQSHSRRTVRTHKSKSSSH